MKTILAVVALLWSVAAHAQSADAILGNYWSPEKDAKIQIFKKGSQYFGKLAWVKSPRKDVNNPDPKLRDRDVAGMVFLSDFTFDGKDAWEDGEIYDAKSGKTYSCVLRLEPNGNLKVRGYVGVAMLGRTEIFERIK